MARHYVYLSIGSNIGKPMKNCCSGIEALCKDGTVRVLDQSPFYKTQPVDYTEQNWFINAAVYVQTRLAPYELLTKIRRIQECLGRKDDAVRFGPRILDIDIIFFDDLIFTSPDLEIPHPRLHKRRFVLQPICDIDPTVVHPRLGKSVQDLLNQLVTNGQDLKLCSSGC